MRIFLLCSIIITILSEFSLKAQPSKYVWNFSDSTHLQYSTSIINTPDYGFMLYGNHYYTNSGGFIIKTDSLGNLLWNKFIGNTCFVTISDIIATRDSCFIIVGRTRINNNSQYNILFMKIALNGDSVWSKEIELSENSSGLDVHQTFDNGFILTGYTSISSSPYNNVVVAKLDSIGNSEWIYKYSDSTIGLKGTSVEQTSDSGFVVTGTFSSKVFLLKLSSIGTLQWMKTYNVGLNFRNVADIEIMPDGYLCFGTLHNSGLLIKTDFSGNVKWCKEYWDMDSFDSHRLYHTHDNGYLMVADTSTSHYGSFIKVDTTGNILWKRSIIMLPTGIIEAPDFDIVVIAWLGGSNLEIIKTDSIDEGMGCLETIINITVTSPNLIVDSLSLTATATGAINQIHPDILTPFLTRDTVCHYSPVSISNITIPQWRIYPNPSSGKFVLSTDNFYESSEIEIYNSIGKIVYTSEINSNEKRIDLSKQSQGIYFIKIKSNKEVHSMKFIISNDQIRN